MPRTSKKKAKSASSGGGFNIFEETEVVEPDADEDLPKDEAGRQKIKQQYVDLLGIRVQKLKGRILNRERINKTVEGIYFICSRCTKGEGEGQDGTSDLRDTVGHGSPS